jgi:hypothetical protein
LGRDHRNEARTVSKLVRLGKQWVLIHPVRGHFIDLRNAVDDRLLIDRLVGAPGILRVVAGGKLTPGESTQHLRILSLIGFTRVIGRDYLDSAVRKQRNRQPIFGLHYPPKVASTQRKGLGFDPLELLGLQPAFIDRVDRERGRGGGCVDLIPPRRPSPR